jgi:hypothetical protein
MLDDDGVPLEHSYDHQAPNLLKKFTVPLTFDADKRDFDLTASRKYPFLAASEKGAIGHQRLAAANAHLTLQIEMKYADLKDQIVKELHRVKCGKVANHFQRLFKDDDERLPALAKTSGLFKDQLQLNAQEHLRMRSHRRRLGDNRPLALDRTGKANLAAVPPSENQLFIVPKPKDDSAPAKAYRDMARVLTPPMSKRRDRGRGHGDFREHHGPGRSSYGENKGSYGAGSSGGSGGASGYRGRGARDSPRGRGPRGGRNATYGGGGASHHAGGGFSSYGR